MFTLAILIGIYSYLIFSMGILGLLFKGNIMLVSILYFAVITIYILKFKNVLKFPKLNFDKTSYVLILLIVIQALINLIGVLGPEVSFDSLWYHLTIPKLYLIGHSIFHIPGGLLYYSDMPKLTEMLYVGALSFGTETIAKFIHFSFGILILLAIYKISRKFVSQRYSLIASLIFYSSLVVGWESITAYVDLARTFFEIMALWVFVNWIEKRQFKNLLISGVMLGLAITTKLISAQSLLIFLALFIYDAYSKKTGVRQLIKNFCIFAIISVVIPLPWQVFSFVNTGNAFYPYFSHFAVDSGQTFFFPSVVNIFGDFYNLFLNLNDPISPLYLILLPLILISLKKANYKIRLLFVYTFTATVIWYLIEQARGGRFILPYLPAFSVLGSYAIYKFKSKGLKTFLFSVVIIVVLSSISYRALANKKFIPVILGHETKAEFLSKNLNFSFGDFYDTDGYFLKNIKPSDKVLLFGFHNLYYVDFPFIDSSYLKKGDRFNYIAVQNSELPGEFSDAKEIYYNKSTNVGLYSREGKEWIY